MPYTVTILSIVNSPAFVAILVAILTASVTFYVGIKTVLTQQRVSRIQRIYYEESLIDQLKHLDNAINITNQNLAYFENVINLIFNDFKLQAISAETIIQLNKIAQKIEFPTRYEFLKRKYSSYYLRSMVIKYINGYLNMIETLAILIYLYKK